MSLYSNLGGNSNFDSSDVEDRISPGNSNKLIMCKVYLSRRGLVFLEHSVEQPFQHEKVCDMDLLFYNYICRKASLLKVNHTLRKILAHLSLNR